MDVKRQKNLTQLKLTIIEECKGEALNPPKWIETSMAKRSNERPADSCMALLISQYYLRNRIEPLCTVPYARWCERESP